MGYFQAFLATCNFIITLQFKKCMYSLFKSDVNGQRAANPSFNVNVGGGPNGEGAVQISSGSVSFNFDRLIEYTIIFYSEF